MLLLSLAGFFMRCFHFDSAVGAEVHTPATPNTFALVDFRHLSFKEPAFLLGNRSNDTGPFSGTER